MTQLDMFSDECKLKHWTPFPGRIGIYYQTAEDKERSQLSIKQWREANPEAYARQQKILEELRADIEAIKNKHK